MENENLQDQPAVQAPPVVSTPPPVPKSNHPIIFVSAIVLFLLLSVGASAFYFGKMAGQPKQVACTMEAKVCPDGTSVGRTGPNCEFSPCPTPTPTIDPTANWKTHINTNLKYSFKYSDSWPLVDVTIKDPDACDETLVFTPNYVPNSGDTTIATIAVCSNPNIKSLDDYKQILINSQATDIKEMAIGGEKAISYTLPGGIDPPIIEYLVMRDNYYYKIALDNSMETNKNRNENIKFFDQMLSTFKFTN